HFPYLTFKVLEPCWRICPVLMKPYTRSPLVRLMAVMACLSYSASSTAAANSVSTQPKVVQKMKAPAGATISGEELAQLSQPKIPSLATEISTASIELEYDSLDSLDSIDLDLGTTLGAT